MRGERSQKNACGEGANFETGVCSAYVCFVCGHAWLLPPASICVCVCVCRAHVQCCVPPASNEISCPRDVPAGAQIEHQ